MKRHNPTKMKGSKKKTGTRPKGMSGKLQPFESMGSRLKHDVMNRRVGGTVTNKAKARSKAIADRQSKLLNEFKDSAKANTFVDERFGERDDGASEEDKILRRFKQERVKRLKKDKFDLNAGDTLTHFGKSLSEVGGAAGMLEDANEDSDGNLEEDTVAHHFGGGAGLTPGSNADGLKSKKEVMQDLIAKSKLYKAERQRAHLQQINLADQLNDSWKDIAGMLEYKDDKAPGPGKAKDSDDPMALLEKIRAEGDKDAAEEDEDDYDMELKRLGLENRFAASDRLKTDEEIAEEQRTRLQELEAKRQRRMHGEVETVVDEGKKRRKNKKGKLMAAKEKAEKEANFTRTDDDLGGNWEIDTKYALKDDDEVLPSDLDESSEEEGGDDDDEEEDEEEEEEEEPEPLDQAAIDAAAEAALKELPFTFEMPKDYKAFALLCKGRSVQEQAMIIERIRACHHLSLGAENRLKLEEFYGILVEFMQRKCDAAGKAVDGQKGGANCKVLKATLSMTSVALWEMTEEMKKFAAKFHRVYLRNLRRAMRARMEKVLAAEGQDKSVSPTLFQICYFQLITKLFPTSDFRHNVCTPSLLIMCETLSRFPIRGARDMWGGLLLAALLVQFANDSIRIIPELLGFLAGALLSGFGLPASTLSTNTPTPNSNSKSKSKSTSTSTMGALPAINFTTGSSIWSSKLSVLRKAKTAGKPDFFLALSASNSHSSFQKNEFLCASFSACLRLIRTSSDLYKQVPSYPEMFADMEQIISAVADALEGTGKGKKNELVVEARELHAMLQTTRREIASSREALTVEVAPTKLKQYDPAYKEDYNPTKDYDPNTERAEMKRLTKKLKREKKGALKELRRDSVFLAKEKHRQTEKREGKLAVTMKRARTQLEELAGDANVWDRQSKRKKLKNKAKGGGNQDE